MAASSVPGSAASSSALWDWDSSSERSCQHAGLREAAWFRTLCKKVMDEKIIPNIDEWEATGDFPGSLPRELYEAGLYGAGWPKEFGGTAPEHMNGWHFYILNDEMGRAGAGGLYASLFTMGIGLPPVIHHASPAIRDKVCRAVITGEKSICLAITEPGGGSDVANIQTTAVLSACGQFYVVNGGKTFISGGMKADFFTVGVKTKQAGGQGGLSLLLVERDMPGMKCTRLQTQGWWSSNTTTIAFDDLRVPVGNLIGEENEGFQYIMQNFNQERRGLAVMANRLARICLEDAVAYARKRKTFGRYLIEHQVIRHKCMEMARAVLATNGFALNVHAKCVALGNDDSSLSGEIALLKVQATKTLELCAREASQIVGGKSYLRQGPGARIERIYREVRVFAIGGGSEEVMLDFASRQAKL